jgi:hypothetical protein
VFILQYQKVQNNCQILVKRAETSVVPIVFKDELNSPNIKKTMTYDVGNQSPVLGQAQQI